PSGHPYDGIYLEGAKDVIISGTRVTGNHDWGIFTDNRVSQLTIENCDLSGNTGEGAASLADEPSSRRVVNTRGYTSESRGSATITSGTTSIAVNHGLAQTPSLEGIRVTPTNSMGDA